MGLHSAGFPRDITHAVSQLFDAPGPHLVDATAEANRLLRMFPDCALTVEQMAELIIRESTRHAGGAVMIGRDG